MSEESKSSITGKGDAATNAEEQEGLLAQHSREGSPEIDAVPITDPSKRPAFPPQRRQSSLAQQRPDGAPRTANRVRFHVEDEVREDDGGHEEANGWLEEEDYLSNGFANGRRDSYGQRAPLLTDIEAPSVTVANSDFNPEDLLESSNSKSGMTSAFMNMANSIM